MVLILAPVKADVINISKIGIKLIEIKNKVFLLLTLTLILNFLTIVKIINKNGSKIINCFNKKIDGFFK